MTLGRQFSLRLYFSKDESGGFNIVRHDMYLAVHFQSTPFRIDRKQNARFSLRSSSRFPHRVVYINSRMISAHAVSTRQTFEYLNKIYLS